MDTLAFSVWNIGTRSPANVLRDMRAKAGDRRVLVSGILRAIIGAIFVVAGSVLLFPAVPNPQLDFAPTELFAFLVALALEHVIGADVRAFAEPNRS